MSAVRIRFASTAEDARRVLAVYRPYIERTSVTFEVDVPAQEDFARRVAGIAREFPYLLLEIGGELAGYAYAHRQAERAAFDWNAELSIYLAEAWRGRGLGRPLYALLQRLLEMQGYVNLYAVITGSNAGSIAMHEAMGFARVGLHERTGYKHGQWHDTVWLHKRLCEGAPGKIAPIGALDARAVAREIEIATREIEGLLDG